MVPWGREASQSGLAVAVTAVFAMGVCVPSVGVPGSAW